MKWELDALKILSDCGMVPGVALKDAINEIEKLRSHADQLATELKMMYREYTPVYFEDPWEPSPTLIAWEKCRGKP